ncbi:hypothetical protein RJ640_019028 [Escallonia rubra]|uniref:Uncharacterized protein n=1 Tax=Escallonia rubra TaxID=112253 RepID=A0AA88QAA4_9ASTE|nr:hypothetical protein RJ640_019028 [Escallonia rubra]
MTISCVQALWKNPTLLGSCNSILQSFRTVQLREVQSHLKCCRRRRRLSEKKRRLVVYANLLPVDPWAPDSQSVLASQLFAVSLFPYLGFLYFITKSKSAPKLTLFGFYFLLVFVGATNDSSIYTGTGGGYITAMAATATATHISSICSSASTRRRPKVTDTTTQPRTIAYALPKTRRRSLIVVASKPQTQMDDVTSDPHPSSTSQEDLSYFLKLGASSVFGAAVIKYGSVIFPDITRPNIVQALILISAPVIVAVLILTKKIPAGIYAKLHYGTSLSNVDWLHGGAESLLTLTNLFIVLGLREGLRNARNAKESTSNVAPTVNDEKKPLA